MAWVVKTLLSWFIVKAARILATASATLVSLANALGISTESSRGRASCHPDQQKAQKVRHSNSAAASLGGSSNVDSDYDEARKGFLVSAGSAYGYRGKVEDLARTEFRRLRGRVYVDHAGATLYSEKQLAAVHKDLNGELYSNPHSGHVAWRGDASSAAVDAEARALTLEMCNASPEDYECIFVSGATGAMKLVAEAFPWAPGSSFVYTRDNHNSAVGMRELATCGGAAAVAVDLRPDHDEGPLVVTACAPWMTQHGSPHVSSADVSDNSQLESPTSLFAYPLESNFSGARYDPAYVARVKQHGLRVLEASSRGPAGVDGHGAEGSRASSQGQGSRRGNWCVLLDAAKACCSAPPDLLSTPADFVAISFYKIFGYPTGLGALIARKESLKLFRKRYFGGGTVTVSVADLDYVRRRAGAAGLEDGTPSYLAVASLSHGFSQLRRLGSFPAIERHAAALTRWLADQLSGLRHSTSGPVCILYGAHDSSGSHPQQESKFGISCLPGAVGQGSVVAFNVLRPNGSYVGYREVEKLAGLCNILLRTGCFCNPGACAAHLGLRQHELISNYEAGHVCWDDNDIINGRPTGAVRVSFGYMSTFDDAYAVLRLVHEYFVDCLAAPEVQARQQSLKHGPAAAESTESASIFHDPLTPATEEMSETAALTRSSSPEQLHSAIAPCTAQSDGTDTEAATSLVPAADEVSETAKAAAATPPTAPVALAGDAHPSTVEAPTAAYGSVKVDCSSQQQPVLQQMWVYPIKSCAGFSPNAWPLGENGLLFDREWALVGADGAALSQKKLPKLATIRPVIKLDEGILEVRAQGLPQPCIIPLPKATSAAQRPSFQDSAQHSNTPITAASRHASEAPAALAMARLPQPLSDTNLAAHDAALGGHSARRQQPVSELERLPSLSGDGSVTGSVISQSGASFSGSLTGSFTSRHSNSAIWPRRSLESRRAGPGAAEAANPVLAAALAREQHQQEAQQQQRRHRKVDLRSVRDRFKHLRRQASGASRAASQKLPSVPEPAAQGPQPGQPEADPAVRRGNADVALKEQEPDLALRQGEPDLAAAAPADEQQGRSRLGVREVNVCADRVCTWQVGVSRGDGDAVSDWFSQALGVRCWLVQQQPGSRHAVERKQLLQRSQRKTAENEGQLLDESERGHSIGFANEGQFLAISSSSLSDVNSRLASKLEAANKPLLQVSAERFRPNLLLGGQLRPYAEDDWHQVSIGPCSFSITGPCARCEVVCTDPEAGQKGGPEPLLTLAAYRRMRGQIHFGILLDHSPRADTPTEWLRVGQPLLAT